MSIRGVLLRLSYQLTRHYIGSLAIGTWTVLVGLAIVVLGLLPKITILPTVMIGAGLVALFTLLLMVWGRLTGFLHFRACGGCFPPAQLEEPMRGLEHVKILATGRFSVEGKERYFANLEAIYHSFESREHAVMAHVPITRFLLLAQSQKPNVGMWYIFFKPGQIRRIERGELEHGSHPQAAIKCVFRAEKRLEEVYLASAREEELLKVAADLWYDAPSAD